MSRSQTTDRDLFAKDVSIERLENRLMLDGSLRVSVNRLGDVTIRGDARSNYVEISREITDQNGDNDTADLVIRGTEDIFGQTTSIRVGRDFVSQVVIDGTDGQFNRKLNIRMGGGNDFLVIRNTGVSGDFRYSPGGGSDSLGIFNSTLQSKSDLRTGSGNDYMNFVDSNFQGPINANTGGGIDFIGMSGFSLSNNQLASFTTGGGADIIYIEDSTVEGDLYANTGGLIDTIYVADGTTLNGSVTTNMGSLFDLLVIENEVELNGSLDVDGGPAAFYENQLFLYEDSPFFNNIPDGLANWEVNQYTTSGVSAYTGLDMSTTLSKWVSDDYYSSQPPINIDVIDTLIAANLARGFNYADLPRSDQGAAPDVDALADDIRSFLNNDVYYTYQKLFVKNAFDAEITTFDWDRF